MKTVKVSYQSINNRLGFNFIDKMKDYVKNIKTEYDGKSPISLLKNEERDFVLEDLMDRKAKGLGWPK